MIQLSEGKLIIQTRTLRAVIDRGLITSLQSQEGEEFIAPFDPSQYTALELMYRGNEAVPVSSGEVAQIETFLAGEHRAELRIRNWHADGNLFIWEDEETGDLCIEPSAYASRPGVRSCRYNVHGLREDMDFIVPITQGTRMKLSDPAMMHRREVWPLRWEMGLWIMQGKDTGFWMHCEDTRYRFKTLNTTMQGDPQSVGMESDNYGPIDNELSAGGIVWRFNVYKGDWTVPAARYRDWYWKQYNIPALQASRPDYLSQVNLGISWCPTDISILEALKKKVDPHKVILHLNNWRPYIYDQDYPVFVPTPEARAFVARCQELGYHVMPHCSSMEIDPSRYDYFPQFADFTIREFESGRLEGWSWVHNSAAWGVPNSNQALTTNKAANVMAKIHTALPMWQSVLRERIGEAVDAMDLEAVFIDVTLCLLNSTRGLVNGTPTTLGFLHEAQYLQTLGKAYPLVIGGEGLNEMNAQGISFGQVHLFNAGDGEVLSRTGDAGLNAFILRGLVRSFGYSGLDGGSELSRIRMKAYTDKGVMPTITLRSAEEIENPNPGMKTMLDMANA